MPAKTELTLKILLEEAASFAEIESKYDEPALFGVTDGKAVGTYLEHKFTSYLVERYTFGTGDSASGIDLPSLNVDIKVTSIRQPQSSCPFKSARQKISGLGYHLIVFVYEKTDDAAARTGRLDMMHTIFVDKGRTGDFQMTRGLRQIIENEGNEEDIVAFFQDKNLPVDDIEARNLAEADYARSLPEHGATLWTMPAYWMPGAALSIGPSRASRCLALVLTPLFPGRLRFPASTRP